MTHKPNALLRGLSYTSWVIIGVAFIVAANAFFYWFDQGSLLEVIVSLVIIAAVLRWLEPLMTNHPDRGDRPHYGPGRAHF